MTDKEFYRWIAQNTSRRVILLEVDTDTKKYLSNVGYVTSLSDTESLGYLPVVSDSFQLTERMSMSGSPTLSVGDIELHNEDGALDAWLDEVWVNRTVAVYIGDASWARSQFRQVFSGVCAELRSRDAGKLNIDLRSKLDRLNTPVSEELLGGDTPNSGRNIPVCLGECHNITPLLAKPELELYRFSDKPCERLIEVRDNGVPVLVDENLEEGTFRLRASAAGTITASVQGNTPYSSTVAGLVKMLATQYGTPTERFTLDDIDEESFSRFDTEEFSVGIYLPDRSNVLQVCSDLAESVGAQLVISNEGLLKLVRIEAPTEGAAVRIGQENYEHASLALGERGEVVAGVKLNYCKNWTVQAALETGIPAEHKDLFAQEWLKVSARDEDVASAYRLYGDTPETDTLLLNTETAQAEADRRLALWSVPKAVYQIKGYAELLELELGQSVVLYGSRFGLNGGKLGQVVGLSPDWISGRTTVEVLI